MNDVTITIRIDLKSMRQALKKIFRKKNIPVLLAIMISVCGIAYAATTALSIPFEYFDGDPIVAEQMNKNFNDLYDKVNLISSDTAGEGLVWLQSEYNRIRTEIDANITSIEIRKDLVKNGPTLQNLPVGTIVSYYGDIANIPSGWALCDVGSGSIPNLVNYFIVAADRDLSTDPMVGSTSFYINQTSESDPNHVHSIVHHHQNSVLNSAGQHFHAWNDLQQYVPASPFGLPARSWNWITYDINKALYAMCGTNNWANEDGYYFGGAGSYMPLALDTSKVNLFNGLLYTNLDDFPHGHSIDPTRDLCANFSSGTSSGISKLKSKYPWVGSGNLPPFYALAFIIKISN